MATREQMMTALRNAHQAGDERSARRIARMIQDSENPSMMDRVGGAAEVAGSMVSGSIAEPAAGMAGIPFQAMESMGVTEPGGAAAVVEGVRDRLTYQPKTQQGQSQIQAVGEFVQPAVEVLQGAEQGLGKAVLERTGSPELAAVAHTLPTAALEALGLAGARRVAKTASPVVRGATGEMSPDARELLDIARQENVPVMTSDVVEQSRAGKLATQTGELIPVAGTGGMRMRQKAKRQALADRLNLAIPLASAEDVFKSLKESASKVKQAAGRAKGNIVERIGGEKADVSRTISAIDEELNRLQFLPNGEPRNVVDTQTVNALNAFKQDLASDNTFYNLDQLRSDFREGVKGDDRNVIRGRGQAAVDRIYNSMTKDLRENVYDKLGASTAQKWEKANSVYAGEARKLGQSRLKNVLSSGDITPEKVNNLLFSKKPSEVKLIYNALDAKGKANARASVIHKALQDATTDGDINPTRFSNNLKKYGATIDNIFTGKDKQLIKGYERLIRATQRAQDFQAMPPTGQTAIGAGALSGAGMGWIDPNFLGTVASAGVAARFYESPFVRDFLLKLANTPPGSSKFDNLLQENLPALGALSSTYVVSEAARDSANSEQEEKSQAESRNP